MLLGILLLLFTPGQTSLQVIAIPASRDATLIEDPTGALANGSGPYFVAGRTNQPANAVRRGLLHFDVAGALPPNAVVAHASLTLHMSQSNSGPVDVAIYRVRTDWGEGSSFSTGSQGAPAEGSDATWLHTFYDDTFWRHPGGDFVALRSATTSVGSPGFYSWNGKLRRDVRRWARAPEQNFGWMLIGDEVTPFSSKRFDSRENTAAELHPRLRITYWLRDGG
jgi:hypothetical protein